MTDFTPSILDNRRGLMMVELACCPLCEQIMVAQPYGRSPFALYIVDSFEKQVHRAGWARTIRRSTRVPVQALLRNCHGCGLAQETGRTD